MEEQQTVPYIDMGPVGIESTKVLGDWTSSSPGQYSHYSGGHPGIDGNYNGNGDSGGGLSSGGPSGGSSNGGSSSSGSSSSSSGGYDSSGQSSPGDQGGGGRGSWGGSSNGDGVFDDQDDRFVEFRV